MNLKMITVTTMVVDAGINTEGEVEWRRWVYGGVSGLGVNNIPLGSRTILTPVTKMDSETCHRLYMEFNTTCYMDRVIDSGTLSFGDGGDRRLVRVSSLRHPYKVRVFNSSPGYVTSTTGRTLRGGPSVVSVGVKYPTPGVDSGNDKDTLVGGPQLYKRVIGTIATIASVPMAMGVHGN